MKTKVSEIAVLNAAPKKYKGVFPTIRYLDTSSVDQGKLLEFQLLDVERDVIPSRAQRAVKDGTIVISSVRPNLKHYAFLKNPAENVVVSSGFVTVDALPERVDSKFLYYALTSAQATKYLDSIASTAVSAYPSFNPEDLGNYVLDIPDSLEEQREIANVLSSVDEKIFNNNAICSNLEAMAKLLYDYWFVQFDFPDENGMPYKASGGKMIWNDELKREIPAGWKVKPLGEYISVIRGISYKPADELKQSSAKSVSLLKSNNIQNGTINFEQPVFLPQQLADKNQWLTEGSVFITMSSGSKAHMGKTAIVYKDLPYVFGAFCAKIVIDDSVRGYLSTYFRSEWFRAYIENVTAGTSINNIGNDQLTNILLPFPDSDIQKCFEDYLKPMFVRQGELGTETQQLASLRDFLLPMLMNGQVKVGKAGA